MKILASMGSIPFKWNPNRGSFSVSTTPMAKFSFFASVLHTVCLLFFLFWRLVQHSQNLESFQTLVWLWISIIFTIWALITLHNVWTKKEEIVAIFDGMKLLTLQLERGKVLCPSSCLGRHNLTLTSLFSGQTHKVRTSWKITRLKIFKY